MEQTEHNLVEQVVQLNTQEELSYMKTMTLRKISSDGSENFRAFPDNF